MLAIGRSGATRENSCLFVASAIGMLVSRPWPGASAGEWNALEGAFGRRAVIERAKGILMDSMGSTRKQRSGCCAISPAAVAGS
jgi:hypothetical protein